jgi:hypothetical protein
MHAMTMEWVDACNGDGVVMERLWSGWMQSACDRDHGGMKSHVILAREPWFL